MVKEEGGYRRGYKLATLRRVVVNGGIIEEIRPGSVNEYDLELSREMVPGSGMLKVGDIRPRPVRS